MLVLGSEIACFALFKPEFSKVLIPFRLLFCNAVWHVSRSTPVWNKKRSLGFRKIRCYLWSSFLCCLLRVLENRRCTKWWYLCDVDPDSQGFFQSRCEARLSSLTGFHKPPTGNPVMTFIIKVDPYCLP